MRNAWVFVDDTDPGIIYSDNWIARTGLATGLDSLTEPESTNTPCYGTVHSTGNDVTAGNPYTVSYLFSGTDFAATFRGANLLDSAKCTVDGAEQTFLAVPGGTLCFNERELSSTKHNMSISLLPSGDSAMSLDWLAFNPQKVPEAETDMLYPMQPTDMHSLTFSFQFNGVSTGIYALLEDPGFSEINPIFCSTLSYSIDSSPYVNITINAPTEDVETMISPQLLLQTPPLLQQQHTLDLKCAKMGNSRAVGGFTAVVQNTTRSIKLTPVPSITSPSISAQGTIIQATSLANLTFSTSATPSPTTSKLSVPVISNTRHLSDGIIAAIVVGIFLVLLLFVAWFWRRGLRRRAVTENNPPPAPQPFLSVPNPAQIGRFRLAQYTTAEKTLKYRQAYGFAIPEVETPSQVAEEGSAYVEEVIEHTDQPRTVRYRIHEDGGETNENDDIISLPPVYDTVARSCEQSHTPSPASPHPKP